MPCKHSGIFKSHNIYGDFYKTKLNYVSHVEEIVDLSRMQHSTLNAMKLLIRGNAWQAATESCRGKETSLSRCPS